MNGMFSDLWDKVSGKSIEAFDTVSSTGAEWASKAVDTAGEWYQAGVDLADQGVQAVESKYDEAVWAIYELEAIQKSVDSALALMDEGPEKEDLIAKRDEARSIFSEYIAPMINQLIKNKKEYEKGGIDNVNKYSNFALLPVAAVAIGVGVASAAAAVIYWASKAYALEEAVLNDPRLDIAAKIKLIQGTGIQGAITAAKTPLIFVGLAIGAYYAYQMVKK